MAALTKVKLCQLD
ncbi:putative nitrite reductase NADPH (Small subunit) oxidoreductase protein, partial [Vibrio parahaemolyticus EKP-021]